MAQKYKAVLTKIGAAKIATATAGGTKINLTQMAVGDGGGTLPTPDPAQTKLIAEKHRAALNKVIVDPKHKNYLVAELVIPPEIGGFWMRELGLYDEVGALIAVSNMAESYKPLLSEGSGRAQTLRMVVIVSDMDTVNLLIDGSTVLATQEYVDDKLLEHEQSRHHPDATLKEKGFTQLSSATNSESEALAATSKAVKAAFDKALEADENAKTADDNAGKANENANTRLEKDKNLSDLNDKPLARKNLALGTAATANVQKSITDNTPNAVMANGAWGLGASGVGMLDSDILSPTSIGNTFFNQGGGVTDRHFGNHGTGIHLSYGSSGDNSQRLTANLFVDGTGNLSVEWLAVIKSTGEIARKYIQKLYGPLNKPTANDVAALPLAGGTMAGAIKVSGTGHGSFSSQNSNEAPIFQYIDTAQTSEYWPLIKQKYKQANATWSAGTLVNANRFLIHYQDATGGGALFSFYKDGQFVPANYANFDAKYQVRGNYTPAGQAYTKVESDGRFQPKGSYTPAGQAYTKAESDTRYAKAVPYFGAGSVGTYTLVATNITQALTFGKPMQGAKLAMLDANQHYYAGSALAGTWIWLGHNLSIGGTWFFGMAYRSA